MSSLTAHQREKLSRFWKLSDVDGSGKVSEDDFIIWGAEVCKRAGIEFNDELKQGWMDAFAVLYPGGSGDDMEKWIDHFAAFFEKPDAFQVLSEKSKALFACVDVDKNGGVDFNEYQYFVEALGVKADTEYSFKMIDTNGDGVLEMSELCEAHARYFWDKEPSAYQHFYGKCE